MNPGMILGVPMGLWAGGIRRGYATGVEVQHHATDDEHAIYVLWTGGACLSSGYWPSFEIAMSHLRLELAQVGHRVFGEERAA